MPCNDTLSEYHSRPGMSKTKLWRILDRCPAYFRFCEEHPPERTRPMLLGSALHKSVLEPEGFADEYAVAPDVDLRTKLGKASYAEFRASNPGKEVIFADEAAMISEMTAAIRSHKYADFLTRGEVEQSYYWTDSLTEIDCQVRPDCFKTVDGRGLIVDLKTCASADTASFMRQAVSLGYDLQAAMFVEGVKLERGIDCDFVFVAIEKEPPYLINILQADELFLRRGYDLFREGLGIFKTCVETGNWYQYNGSTGIVNNLGLPAWLAKDFE